MSIEMLQSHYGFTRMPFGNYAEAATMPRRVREGHAGRGRDRFGGSGIGIVSRGRSLGLVSGRFLRRPSVPAGSRVALGALAMP